MVSAFDQRIINVGIEIDGNIYHFEGLNIIARGCKFMSALSSKCEIVIYNLTQEHRNFILTRASPNAPAPRTPINLTLDVGRESYGTFRLFEGQVYQGGLTQPPDIGIYLSSLTQNFQLAETAAYTKSSISTVYEIAQMAADALGLTLIFKLEANKQVENFSYTGTPEGLIKKINQIGGVVAYKDNKSLIVSAPNQARNQEPHLINMATGMVGIPQSTAMGVVVKTLVDNTINIGDEIIVESLMNPSANGNYIIKQIEFEIASRDVPFWYTMNCLKKQYDTGTQ